MCLCSVEPKDARGACQKKPPIFGYHVDLLNKYIA